MTKREAAIVAAYTGYFIGEFDEMHKYIEEVMKRPVWTHELASPAVVNEIQQKSKTDFMTLVVE